MVDNLFTRENPGTPIKAGRASRRLADAGLTHEQAATQLRGFARKELVRPPETRGDGKIIHQLFAIPDLAVAKILSILISVTGIAKPGLMEWISDWLYSWPPSHPQFADRFATQVHAAMSGINRGEEWTCRIDVFTHDRTGAEMACAYLFRGDAPPVVPWELDSGPVRPVGQPDTFEESAEHNYRGSITLPVTEPLSRLLSDPAN